MRLLRLVANTLLLSAYLIRLVAYGVARIFGSWLGGAALCILAGALYSQHREAPAMIYGLIAFIIVCRSGSRYLKPRSRPRFLRAPPPPLPPPPRASTATGRSDDPDEATVIGRLDPKLRDLMHRKTDGAAL